MGLHDWSVWFVDFVFIFILGPFGVVGQVDGVMEKNTVNDCTCLIPSLILVEIANELRQSYRPEKIRLFHRLLCCEVTRLL